MRLCRILNRCRSIPILPFVLERFVGSTRRDHVPTKIDARRRKQCEISFDCSTGAV
jgi:hypothetical protein